VESHADIMDRMFGRRFRIPGNAQLAASKEAACVPARNIKQFLETLVERGDTEGADQILRNYWAA